MDKSTQYWAVIPATGTGQRMQADRPKQYLQLSDRTVLEHTLDNLLSHPDITGAVLILNEKDQFWDSLCYQHEKPVLLCTGGEQRHHSVYNGLLRLKQQVDVNPVVLIHDAVRPCVSHDDLDKLLVATDESEDGALLAVPVTDTLKLSDERQCVKITHPRDNLWRALTPQAFNLNKILDALSGVVNNNLDVTDDASAMELKGYHPRLVLADGYNIKITYPQDLLLAELILNARLYS